MQLLEMPYIKDPQKSRMGKMSFEAKANPKWLGHRGPLGSTEKCNLNIDFNITNSLYCSEYVSKFYTIIPTDFKYQR